eukprot:363250-Chlamydomonas_euryale.AAC.3
MHSSDTQLRHRHSNRACTMRPLPCPPHLQPASDGREPPPPCTTHPLAARYTDAWSGLPRDTASRAMPLVRGTARLSRRPIVSMHCEWKQPRKVLLAAVTSQPGLDAPPRSGAVPGRGARGAVDSACCPA